MNSRTFELVNRVPIGSSCVVSGKAYYRGNNDKDGNSVFYTAAMNEKQELVLVKAKPSYDGIFDRMLLDIPVKEKAVPEGRGDKKEFRDPLSLVSVNANTACTGEPLHKSVQMRHPL